jgi:hypothetical protein
MANQLYMVIDVTTVEETKIRFVAERETAILLGKIYALEHPGRKVIAPPVEGRGFSKVDTTLQLQYLFWNTFGLKPNDDYATLRGDCLTEALKLVPTHAELAVLQGKLAEMEDAAPNPARAARAPRAPKVSDAPAAPKKTSTCGLVWELCEKHLAAGLALDSKELRAAIMANCEQEGINKSTAGVQYGKWKASKQPATGVA